MERGRRLGPVLLTVLLDLLGFGLVIPLLSYYSEQFGATPFQVTCLMASYSLAQFVFAPVWGGLSDRIGRRPVMLISIGGTALGLAAFALAPSLLWLFVARVATGMCAANIGTAQAYVADVTQPKDRAKGMGMIGAAFGVGFSFGPWVGGELSAYGLAVPIWAAAGLSAVNFVWALFGLPESRPLEARAKVPRVRDPRLIVSALQHPVVGAAIGLTFVATFAFAMLESSFSLVAEHQWGMDAVGVGRLFGVIGTIGIVIQGGLIGRLSRRFGERVLVGVGYAGTAAGMLTLGFAASSAAIWTGCVLIAIGNSLSTPSLQALISQGAGDHQGALLGVIQSLGALARTTAPPLGGAAFARIGSGAPMVVGAALMAIALLISIPATRRARPRET
jgi:MFS family permease